MFKLRGHHLFCLLGYRGMGYSPEYVENMTRLHQTLRSDAKTLIQLVKGPDELCGKYPITGVYHCQDENIYKRDAAILEKLGLSVGQIVTWEDIESQIRKHATPADIPAVCETCSWRSYGVCEEGVQDILDRKGLRKVR